jgi:Mg2+-importing ATPase
MDQTHLLQNILWLAADASGAIVNPFDILLTIPAIISAATQQIPTFVAMMTTVFSSTGLRFFYPVSLGDSLILPQVLARFEFHDLVYSLLDQASHDEAPVWKSSNSISRMWFTVISRGYCMSPSQRSIIGANIFPGDCVLITAEASTITQASFTGEMILIKKTVHLTAPHP